MTKLLETTGDDIAQLGDAELRDLIGLLCEADYKSAGLSVKGITWGGHQNAADGGLDVVVRGEIAPPVDSFVPRSNTGIQVKKPDMPRAKILEEMRPKGVLRDAIKDLIKNRGAYIIVSSNGSTADTALQNRSNAMRDAIAEEDPERSLHLEFLDRGRIATWVRSHASLMIWVRNKIGRPLRGWRAYDNWAEAPSGVEEEYLLDDGMRLIDGSMNAGVKVSAEEGLHKLRSALSVPGTSIRLAGLSGVGKTRLVQALFDKRIGDKPLNSSQAVYTDIAEGPNPDPLTLANQLIVERSRAFLIIDNCPPDLHRQLTKICSKPRSTTSLLTVEYDVRDDVPEETRVFRLEPASEEIIEKLIIMRFPHISQVDAQTIAEFSGGNARIGIALASTLRCGETLSGFRDEDLFERLFWQRHESNLNFLVSAEVCSLVYSFEGTDLDSDDSELQFLASLINKSGAELYRDVAELQDRDLIQSRSVWRAVLPHAIANRLAKRALNSIPKSTLIHGFLNNSSERLVKSFSRRLGYLHDHKVAIEIVDEWLGPEGWIGKSVCNLNDLGIGVLINIAPVSPEQTLKAIERAANGAEGQTFVSKESAHRNDFVRLLKHLAFDPKLFGKSLELLCRYALAESKNDNYNSTRNTLGGFFHLYLSGTHASVEDRKRTITQLIESDSTDKQNLGFHFLDAALEAWHFTSSHEYAFGARSRDYGFRPKIRTEVTHWFDTFISYCTELALSDKNFSDRARKTLANRFRGLWTKGGMYDALETSARQIHANACWNHGWIAVCETIRYSNKKSDKEIMARLLELKKQLEPEDLLEKVRTFALSDKNRTYHLDDDRDLANDRSKVEEMVRSLGARVAQDDGVFRTLLPDLMSTPNARLFSFGQGLADGSSDQKDLFMVLRSEFENTLEEKRQISVLLGFLSSISETNPSLSNTILDDLIKDDVLGSWFPIIQTTLGVDQKALKRFHKAWDHGIAPVHTFEHLAWGKNHEPLSDDELATLLKKFLTKEKGVSIALEILNMRIHGQDKQVTDYSSNLVEVARETLSLYTFPKVRSVHSSDYRLSEVARVFLKDPDGVSAANQLCQHLYVAMLDYSIYCFDYPRLLNSLAQIQPTVFLDAFLRVGHEEQYILSRMFSTEVERHENPLDQISDSEILAWCEIDSSNRYQIVTSAVRAFGRLDETEKLEWKPLVFRIFEQAPDLKEIFKRLEQKIQPMSYGGSLADVLQSRLDLFLALFDHENTQIQAWAEHQYSSLQEWVSRERQREERERSGRYQSFE